MDILYYPSCKFTASSPETSKRIKDYLTEKYDAKIAECCRASLKSITNDDTVVYVCNTCAAFFAESTPAKNVISIWELLVNDTGFSYQDYRHKRMAVQDCWRTYDNTAQQDAVRKILDAMGIEIEELENNRQKTRFCGKSLYEPLPANYAELAPNRLARNAEGLFTQHSDDEKNAFMQDHCRTISADDVVCYCVACANGIIAGGKLGIHLADLVFANI